MTVSVTSFQDDYSTQFGNESMFPPSSIAYWIAVAGLLLNPNYWGAGSSTPQSPPTTMVDFATELFVAHNLALEAQAAKAASVGGIPGQTQGVISSKGVGSVSLGYDVNLVTNEDGSFWNATQYGVKFLWLARLVGSGPVQIGIGRPPLPFLTWTGWGNSGWAGPPPWLQPSDCGFA